MEERSVVHDTVVVCRTYETSAERVYRAWSDRAELERWYVPGDEKWTAKMLNHDFRVGGGKRFMFGPPDQTFVEGLPLRRYRARASHLLRDDDIARRHPHHGVDGHCRARVAWPALRRSRDRSTRDPRWWRHR